MAGIIPVIDSIVEIVLLTVKMILGIKTDYLSVSWIIEDSKCVVGRPYTRGNYLACAITEFKFQLSYLLVIVIRIAIWYCWKSFQGGPNF